MTNKPERSSYDKDHKAFLQEIYRNIRQIMANNYKIKKITIQPINAGASRLSIPIKITGVDEKGKTIHYFGKIIGYSDILFIRSIQFAKNIYLQMNTSDPIFETYETTEDMVRDQYEMMQAIYKSGIPAIKPYGYHQINGTSWLLVTEYLDAKPFSKFEKVDSKQIDTIFNYLKKAHHKKIFHGDIKPDNIMVGDKIYILDVGHFRKKTPAAKKQSYDLACMISSLLQYQPVEDIIRIARKHFSHQHLKAAAEYIELIQLRPDIHFSDETKKKLLSLLTSKRRVKIRKRRKL